MKSMEIAILLFVSLSVIMIAYSLRNLFRIFSCKTEIDAYCMGTDGRHSGFSRGKTLFVTFSYRYDGKDYYRESKLGVTMKLYNSLRQGEQYRIYINENKPEMYVVERKATGTEIFYLIAGILLLAVAAFMYILLLV